MDNKTIHTPTLEPVNFTKKGLIVYAVYKEMGQNRCVELEPNMNQEIFKTLNAHDSLVKCVKGALELIEGQYNYQTIMLRESFKEALKQAGVKV